MKTAVLLFQLFGCIGLFLFGMRLLSESLQRFTVSSFRDFIQNITKSNFRAWTFGFVFTNITQSSSASIVSVIGLINARMLSMKQAFSFVLGANLGTTSTLWFVAILGFSKVPIVLVCLVLAGIALPLLFSQKKTSQKIAEVIFGFGIMFIALDYLKTIFPELLADDLARPILESVKEYGFFSYILFLILGIIFTAVFQSSSATSALTLGLVAEEFISPGLGFALILGENIGTTSTALIASTVGIVKSKRVAYFHTIVNSLGALIVIGFVPILVDPIVAFASGIERLIDSNSSNFSSALSIVVFHTSFNGLLSLIFLPLLNTARNVLQPRGEDKQRPSKGFISGVFFESGELNTSQAYAKLVEIAKIVAKMGGNISIMFFSDTGKEERLLEKVKDREEQIDQMEIELADYLTQLSENELSTSGSKEVRTYIEVLNELERMADMLFSMSKVRAYMLDNGLKFKEDIRYELEDYFTLTRRAIEHLVRKLEHNDFEHINSVYSTESSINEMRTLLKEKHFERMEKGIVPIKLGISYIAFIDETEDLADRIVRIHEKMRMLS